MKHTVCGDSLGQVQPLLSGQWLVLCGEFLLASAGKKSATDYPHCGSRVWPFHQLLHHKLPKWHPCFESLGGRRSNANVLVDIAQECLQSATSSTKTKPEGWAVDAAPRAVTKRLCRSLERLRLCNHWSAGVFKARFAKSKESLQLVDMISCCPGFTYFFQTGE